MEPNEAFDFCDITGIRLQSAKPADNKDLVRIEGVIEGLGQRAA
jgi:hypothetical protein